MNIVFVEVKPPCLHVYSKVLIPRLGTPLLGTILRDHGHDVTIYFEEIQDVSLRDLRNADVVCLSTLTSSAPRGYWIADKVRAMGIPVVMGGAHAHALPEEALLHADYVVRGEGENVIVELMECIENKRLPYKLPNVSFSVNGKVEHNPLAPLVQNLDANPILDYSLIEGWKTNRKVVAIETSRGCPYACKFCSVVNMFGRKYRFRSIDRVIDELRSYNGKTQHVFFVDDNFTAHPERTKKLLRRMEKEQFSFSWSAQVRVEAAQDDELLGLLKRTRCYVVYVGFESINPMTLKSLNKRQSIENIEFFIRRFHKHGIFIHGMFMFGSDYDDVDTVRETELFIKKRRIDSVQLLALTPLPGTAFFKQVEEEDRIFHKDWKLYDGHNVVFDPKRISAYELQHELYKTMSRIYTLSSAARYLLRLEFYYTIVRLYGKKMSAIGSKITQAYKNSLRQFIRDKVSRLKNVSLPVKTPKVIGIPRVFKEDKGDEFFRLFLKKLGFDVVMLKTQAFPKVLGKAQTRVETIKDSLTIETEKLKKHLDLVVVPFFGGVGKTVSDSIGKREEIIAALKLALESKRIHLLPLEINPDALYKQCIELGLLLNQNLIKVRRAYYFALRRTNILPGTA